METKYKNTTIRITSGVYEPCEDSFLLADAALACIKDADHILEAGCGSGIISAVINANTKASIIGIDISPHAVKCTKENGIQVIRGDLLNCIKGKFDIIIFNPPYLPTREFEKEKGWMNAALDGGPDGRQVIYRFLDDAGFYLVNHGKILMLVSSLTGIEEIKSRMLSLNFSVEEVVQERFMFEQLVVLLATKL
ncbi:MAG: HemK2/MTQ2 family protein methyltransferase [Candidatus Methanoperedens sp.]